MRVSKASIDILLIALSVRSFYTPLTNAFIITPTTKSITANTPSRRSFPTNIIKSTSVSTKLFDSFLENQNFINTNTHKLTCQHNNSRRASSLGNSPSPTSTTATTSTEHGEDFFDYSRRRVNNRHAAKDWLHNVASIPKSTVLKDIRNPLLTIFTWSTFISIIHKFLFSHDRFQHLALKMCIGTQMHSLMISSLGLLLVFRTNSAYQRFVEGRKIWEQILGIARNIDRMVSLYVNEIGEAKAHRMKHYLASFPYLLRHHIRPRCLGCDSDTPQEYRMRMEEFPYDIVETRHEGDKTNGGIINSDDNPDFSFERRPQYCWVDKRSLPWSLLDDHALSRCANAINRPLWSCNSIADEVISIPYGPNFTSRERLSLLSSVDKLSNAIGQCERIHQTAVPLNYARHSLRSLSLWLFTLPFALVKDLGLLTGPICGITAWLMFGVYQIGHSIEDPFQKTLRLSILCNAIRRDVLGENQYRPTPSPATATAVSSASSSDIELQDGHEFYTKASSLHIIEVEEEEEEDDDTTVDHLTQVILPHTKPILYDGSGIIEPIHLNSKQTKKP